MSRFSKIPAILVAAGLMPAVLPLGAQASDIDALKAQVQKLSDQVKELKDQQKTDQTAKTAVTNAGGLSTNVLGGTITLYGDIDMYFNHMSSSSGAKRDRLMVILPTSRRSMVRAALLPEALTTCGRSMMTGPSGPTSTLYSERSPWIRPTQSMRATCCIRKR